MWIVVDLVGCGGFGVVVDGVGLWMVDVRMGMIFKVEQTGTDGWMDVDVDKREIERERGRKEKVNKTKLINGSKSAEFGGNAKSTLRLIWRLFGRGKR